MNPLDRLDPNRAWISHQSGACEPDCVYCRVGEGYTPEGLQVVDRIIDVPGKGRRWVTREVSRTGEVIFESWAAPTPSASVEVWVAEDNGLAFLARKLIELERRWKELPPRSLVDPIERAQVKRDRNAARQRLRRLVGQGSSVVVQLDGAEERRMVREVLADDSPTIESDDEIEFEDAAEWLSGQVLDPCEVARLTLERPVIVIGSVA